MSNPLSDNHHYKTNQPILIVGGGLAGLSLGQGLKQSNIPFRIYERDSSAAFRAQGYRIRIGDAGATALEQLLPPHLFQAFTATCAEVEHGGHAVDAVTGQPLDFQMPGAARKVHGDRAFNADRAVLRNVLLSGLEGYVEFGRRLEGYEVRGEDEVVARFTDGSEAMGRLLVGADGVRSVVRHQILPNLTVLDTEGQAVFGKTVLTDSLRNQIPKDIGHGLTIASVQGESRLKLFTDGMRFNRAEAIKQGDPLGLHIPEDYIYWVLLFRGDMVSEDDHTLLSLSREGSARKSLEITESWHESLRALLQNQVVDAASTLSFLTSTPSFGEEWTAKSSNTAGRVTLIGDSAHPMPPVGGIGANIAFQDSADLLARVREAIAGGDWNGKILAYEQDMLDRVRPAIEMSAGGAGKFFGMKALAELKPATLWHS